MPRLRLALLAAAVAVTAHDATYVVGHGPADVGAALSATGHDGYWLAVAGGVVAILAAVAAATAWRWRTLRRQLAAAGAAGSDPRTVPSARTVMALAVRLAAGALTIFVVQENLETVGATGAVPGPAILWSGGSAAAVPVFVAIALLFASLVTLATARIRGLEIALARTLPRPRRIAVVAGASLPAGRPRRASSRPDLGRAPPAPVPTTP